MSDDATDADARYQERIIMDDRPHVDGLTRGTVIQYDGWQWGVVTEVAEETEPTKVGFVLIDELGDWVVRDLEAATGCAEHFEAVRTFRDGEHEYWTPAEYIQNGDAWEVLGPIHPDARDDEPELATDGGVDQSEAGGNQSSIMRHMVRRPNAKDGAGVAVSHVRNPPPHETEYRVEQLWPNGEAEPVFIGDRDDALELISALTEAIQNG